METLHKRKRYLWITFVFSLLLLLLLVGFQSIWVYGGSASSIMLQIGLQRARNQAIAKNVLTLSYRTDDQERALATSELQNILPQFEKTQAGMQSGDKGLQLPRAPSDIQQILFASQPHYVAIDGALKQIVAHASEPLSGVQRDIILIHVADYANALSQIHLAWQARIDSAFVTLFWYEIGLTISTMMLIVLSYFFQVRPLLVDPQAESTITGEEKEEQP